MHSFLARTTYLQEPQIFVQDELFQALQLVNLQSVETFVVAAGRVLTYATGWYLFSSIRA